MEISPQTVSGVGACGAGQGLRSNPSSKPAGATRDSVVLNGQDLRSAELYSRASVLQSNRPGQGDPAEEEQVRQLRARDSEVRQHEAAHLAVLGRYARGGASFAYQIGPDGKAYAVGGSVTVDMSEESSAAATQAKARQLMFAAVSSTSPSAADMAVGARAGRLAITA